MNSIGNHETIMNDRNLFNQVVYTPMSDALRLLADRRNDPELVAKIRSLLHDSIPDVLEKNTNCAVHFRQVATPNQENKYFVSLSLDHGLQPVFFEFIEDKFTSNNEYKHSLGQLRVHNGINKNGDYKRELVTIVDFNKYNGKKLKEVVTLWEEPLMDFHKRLFNIYGEQKDGMIFYDASEWFKENGGSALGYYENFFLLFICNGILFENFLTLGTEGEFSKKIVLPAIEKVYNLTGLKPLIVPIPPMDIEEDEHWISYDPHIKEFLNLQ